VVGGEEAEGAAEENGGPDVGVDGAGGAGPGAGRDEGGGGDAEGPLDEHEGGEHAVGAAEDGLAVGVVEGVGEVGGSGGGRDL
jgi:hypothetical protein